MLAAVDAPRHLTCAGCGFDGGAWTERDAADVLDALGLWWRLATAGITTDDLDRRPWPRARSVDEHGRHLAHVAGAGRHAVARLLADEAVLPRAEPPTASAAPGPVALDLDLEGRALAEVVRGADTRAWERVRTLDGEPVTAGHLLRRALHDATHDLMDVGRALAELGTPATQEGRVAQVNTSAGGVPKRAVDRLAVTTHGVAGDRQAERKHHGRPFQALCLWSLEVIEELADLGHPIRPGSAGENVTVQGLDWTALRPGTQLRIGTVLAEVSFAAIPCVKIGPCFSDGDFRHLAPERNPGWVRWYAWVREPGEISTGDAVVVRP